MLGSMLPARSIPALGGAKGQRGMKDCWYCGSATKRQFLEDGPPGVSLCHRCIRMLACSSAGRFMSVFAQTPVVAKSSLIDVHHHFVPPFYLSDNRDRIATSSGGRINPAWLSWAPEQAIAAMDKQGVATAVLSLTFPGVWFGDPQAAAQTARRVTNTRPISPEVTRAASVSLP